MRRILLVIFAACLLCTGAAQAGFRLDVAGVLHFLANADEAAESIACNGVNYRTGFYGEDCGFRPEIQGETVVIDGEAYSLVNSDRFSMLLDGQGVSNGILSGVLYCAEDQLEAACAWYADDANYDYYCRVGAQYVDRDPEYRLLDMDAEMFHRLMDFAAENAYDPFGVNRSNSLLRLPIPDRDAAPELTFYRESRDGCIVSYQGHHFHIVDGKLLFVYFYDYGHGEYAEMAAVEAPAELSDYFVNLLENSAC